jgi:hypothetical protein
MFIPIWVIIFLAFWVIYLHSLDVSDVKHSYETKINELEDEQTWETTPGYVPPDLL